MRTLLLCLLLVSSSALANSVSEIMIEAIRNDDLEKLETYASDKDLLERAMMAHWTPLHEAAYHDKVEATQILLKYDADRNALDGNGWTPLYIATLQSSVKMIIYLAANGASVR